MKTIKRSNSMKVVLTLALAISLTALVNGQAFQTPNPDSPVNMALEEVRTGSSISYDLSAGHTAGEAYRWEVTGGEIIEVNGTAVGATTAVDFTVDATSITVDWNGAVPSDITALSGQIQVQKRSTVGCYSQLTTLPIDVWNNATATITTGSEAICSGDSPGIANVAVALTGAPDGSTDGFAVNYVFTVPGGLDIGGAAVSGTVTTDGASVDIPLPGSFVNSTSGDLDFVVSLDSMHDDFTGDGTVSGTYTITVHPVPTTGSIVSGSSLNRR